MIVLGHIFERPCSTMYVLYSQDTINMFAVNVMIGLAIAHFSLIIIFYRIITCVLSRNRSQLCFSTLIELITRAQRLKRGPVFNRL